jgi:hypothetical protein
MNLSNESISNDLHNFIVDSAAILNKTYHASVILGKIEEIKDHIKAISKVQTTRATLSFTPDVNIYDPVTICIPAELAERVVDTIIKYDEQRMRECLSSLNAMWGAK